MTETITGLFDTYQHASEAVGRLESAGVPHSDISIVASNADDTWQGTDRADQTTTTGAGTGATAGTVLGGGAGLLAGLGMLAIPGVGPVVAAGWLVATITGAGVGAAAGGLLGSLTGHGVQDEHAHVYAEGVRRGGSLVTARVADDKVTTARSILTTGNAVDPTARRAAYQQQGWTGFDDKAPAYTRDEVAQERLRYNADPRTPTTGTGTGL